MTITDPDLPGGKKVIEVPVEGHKKGQDENGTGTGSFAKLGEKCAPTLLGWGVPLLALIPLGIATQARIPGLENIQNQVSEQIRNANNELQKQLGIMNPEAAKMAAEFNDQFGRAVGPMAVLALGIAAVSSIAVNCAPGSQGGSSLTTTKVGSSEPRSGGLSSARGEGASSKTEGGSSANDGKGSSLQSSSN